MVVVVPEEAIPQLWTTTPAHDVFLVAVKGDYTDAITVSNALAAVPGCVPEGGAKNVARRDGMGTVMLDAAVTLGRIPDHYFQAVGSGTGAIAAWEAALRLIGDGRYGTALPRLHLAQNKPFTPLVSAWQQRRRTINPDLICRMRPMPYRQSCPRSLPTANPPTASREGSMMPFMRPTGACTRYRTRRGGAAAQLLRDTEGIDPDPAAAVATAALVQAAETGAIGRDDHILLNITGGGYERIREDYTLYPLKRPPANPRRSRARDYCRG